MVTVIQSYNYAMNILNIEHNESDNEETEEENELSYMWKQTHSLSVM